jgi:NAD-dependent SIR2 family protein deacetylase
VRSRKNDELTTLRARLAKTIGEWRTKTRQCTELHHQLDAAATAIVSFGEYVPKDRVAQAYSLVDDAEALLVAGSSLAVLSGYRFVRHAATRGIPIAIVNRGTDPQ